MNQALKILLIAAFVLTSCSKKESTGEVIATYNGKNLTKEEFLSEIKSLTGGNDPFGGKSFDDLSKPEQEFLVKQYVASKLIEMEAKNSGFDKQKEYIERLNKIQTQLLQDMFIEKNIVSTIKEEEIDKEYEKIQANFKDRFEIKMRHILVKTQEEANDVYDQLQKGGNFAKLAAKYSVDPNSKNAGGELGYFIQGQMIKPLEDVALSLAPEEISKPVQTNFGWHIVSVGDRRKANSPSKEQAKQFINQKLLKERLDKQIEELEKKFNFKLTLADKKDDSKKEEAKKEDTKAGKLNKVQDKKDVSKESKEENKPKEESKSKEGKNAEVDSSSKEESNSKDSDKKASEKSEEAPVSKTIKEKK